MKIPQLQSGSGGCGGGGGGGGGGFGKRGSTIIFLSIHVGRKRCSPYFVFQDKPIKRFGDEGNHNLKHYAV